MLKIVDLMMNSHILRLLMRNNNRKARNRNRKLKNVLKTPELFKPLNQILRLNEFYSNLY